MWRSKSWWSTFSKRSFTSLLCVQTPGDSGLREDTASSLAQPQSPPIWFWAELKWNRTLRQRRIWGEASSRRSALVSCSGWTLKEETPIGPASSEKPSHHQLQENLLFPPYSAVLLPPVMYHSDRYCLSVFVLLNCVLTGTKLYSS